MYLENHDQVANSASGERLHQFTSPAAHRAMTGWMLLGPATPMLFQGQESSSSAPCLFFADHGTELGEAVRRGRVEFLAQFPSLTDDRVIRSLAPPGALATFTACKLDLTERERHRQAYDLHRDLLALRRDDPALSRAGTHRPEGAAPVDRAPEPRCIDAARGHLLSLLAPGGPAP